MMLKSNINDQFRSVSARVVVVQVYPEKTAEISIRRLLLENVFLLAGRRIPVDANLNVGDETVCTCVLI